MTKPLALAPKDCQGKRWHVSADLAHLQHQPLIPLHAGELAKTAASMPLALVKLGGQWQFVAVCGVQPQHNLFIKNGQWLGSYMPAWLDSYPFDIVTVGDKSFATFDQDSGLLATTGQGEAFFDAADQLTPAVAQRVEVLKVHHGLHATTQKGITALHDAKLITPWPETMKQAAGLQIDGLHMVDEKAMAQLSDEVFLNLRKAQALPIAYAVNFSIQQLHLLGRLQRLSGQAASGLITSDTGDLDLEFLNDSGTISFGPH